MTELEHVEIEGFKGLEHVEFEPSDINLITGRNNTGKTSFLEGMNLLFYPENIKNLSKDLSKIVNIGFDKATVRTEERDLQVRYPSENEALDYLINALLKLLSDSAHWQRTVHSYGNSDVYPEWVEDERITNALTKAATRTINAVSKDLFSPIENICLTVEIEGQTYPYVKIGDKGDEIFPTAHEELEKALKETFEEFTVKSAGTSIVLKKGSKETEYIAFEVGSRKTTKGQFLNEPPSGSNMEFIRAFTKNVNFGGIEKDKNAIKIDDINDYIKEVGLVDNLKTFNLDYLIFENGDGDKYDIPFDFMGDGFKSIIGLLWELMDEKTENSIVLIEEPENHMHPGYIREIVYFLINIAHEEDVQLFITTHDSDFINDFFTENLTDEEEAYLEEEFSLLRMEEDSAVVENYETARENLKDLHLDLRGI